MTDRFVEHWAAFDRRAAELGHKLIRDEDGEIDHFVLDMGYHNGPGCEVCRADWCHHCSGVEDITACDGGVAYRARQEAAELAELDRIIAKYSASAIEARRAATTGAVEDESAVPQGDAQ